MMLRRLGWAGIELRAGDATLVIDAIGSAGAFAAFLGPQPDQLLAPSQAPLAALLTHLHRDHADAEALESWLAPGAPVLRPAPAPPTSAAQQFLTGDAETALAASGLTQVRVSPGERHTLGPFVVAATFASDGLGSPQIGWVIEASGRRVLHGGDTVWHGHWWEIAERCGPIDLACLPANGARVAYPILKPSVDEPAVMTPSQAAQAAAALGAPSVLAIHYNMTFTHERFYRPFEGAEAALQAAATQLGVTLLLPPIGHWITVPKSAPVASAAPPQ